MTHHAHVIISGNRFRVTRSADKATFYLEEYHGQNTTGQPIWMVLKDFDSRLPVQGLAEDVGKAILALYPNVVEDTALRGGPPVQEPGGEDPSLGADE